MALPAMLVLQNKEAKLPLDKFRQSSEDVRTQQGVETVKKMGRFPFTDKDEYIIM